MMRELLFFDCEGETLAGTLDRASGTTGVIVVTGGSQTRIGAHRGFALLTARLAEAGYPCLRYDRRGVGDSSGIDGGFTSGGPDLAAALAEFRTRCPALERVVGFGLCDGATTLCLNPAGLDAVILANPWVVEAAAGEPPPAAIGRRYREQLTSLAGWKRLLTGGIDYRKAIRGVMTLLRPRPRRGSLAEKVAGALAASPAPAHLVLAEGDATAIAFEHEWRRGALQRLAVEPRFSLATIATDAHSFAREGDFEALVETCLAALERFAEPR